MLFLAKLESSTKALGLLLASVSFAISANAKDCAPGFSVTSQWKTKEVYVGWIGSNASLCQNIEDTSLNDPRKGYGIDYGSFDYQCGSIRIVNSYLSSVSSLNVLTRDGSRSIHFSYDHNNQTYDEKLTAKCTSDGSVCFRKFKISTVFSNSYTPDKIVRTYISGDYFECSRVGF